MKDNNLPLPAVRCLSKEEAATYLGIGVTLLTELDIPAVKFGRRTVYDKVDLDLWLEEYKRSERRRVGKDLICANPKKESISGQTRATGGLVQRSLTAKDYAKALGLNTDMKPKPF
jgi:hypothetical protein